MREAIADARPVFTMGENNAPRLLFKGEPAALEIVSAANGERETGGLYLVRYSLDADGTLIAERQLLRHPPSGKINKVTLLRNVSSLAFEYPGEPGRKDTLPNAIAVSLTFAAGDSRIWPRTFVRVSAAR